MRRRRFWSLAGVAGLVAAVSLLVVPALGQNPIITETGVLHLDMDSNPDRFVLFDSAGVEQTEQLLTASNCKLGTAAVTGPLVNVAASGTKNPFPGLKDHRLGVGQNGEGTGEKCGQINRDKSQALTLSFTGDDLEGQSIGYAELNLEFKFNGDVILETRLAGDVKDTITVTCNAASDCGPDSGGSDNKLVILSLDPLIGPEVPPITSVFDTIVIKPGNASPSGAVSLEGNTLFKLVDAFDGEIACGETEPLVGEDATLSITRGFDTHSVDEEPACKGPVDGLLFNFESGMEEDGELFVDFIAEPVDSDPDTVAQFLEVITWRFDSPPNVDADEPQHRTLSYDDHLTPTENKRAMPWCISDPRDENGNLPVGTVLNPVDPFDYVPAGHTSCLIESRSRVAGFFDILDAPPGTFIKVDVVYNFGDGKRWS